MASNQKTCLINTDKFSYIGLLSVGASNMIIAKPDTNWMAEEYTVLGQYPTDAAASQAMKDINDAMQNNKNYVDLLHVHG